MKYAHFDKKTGKIIGFYDDQIHEEIPAATIELTESQWREVSQAPAQFSVSKDALVKHERSIAEKLALAQQSALSQCNALYSQALSAASGNPPQAEVDTWVLQEQWARAFIADDTQAHLQARLLKLMRPDELSQAKNNKARAKVIANGIIGKADRLAEMSAILLGITRTARKSIETSADQAGIDAALSSQKTAINTALQAASGQS